MSERVDSIERAQEEAIYRGTGAPRDPVPFQGAGD